MVSSTEFHAHKIAVILEQSVANLFPGVSGALTLLKSIDAHLEDKPKDDFSNFRNDLRDFLNPVTSRMNGAAEGAAAAGLPNRDAVFPAFRP